MSVREEYRGDGPNPPHLRGPIYDDAVWPRGGHEYCGGPVEWEPTSCDCDGCPVCRSPVPMQAGGRR